MENKKWSTPPTSKELQKSVEVYDEIDVCLLMISMVIWWIYNSKNCWIDDSYGDMVTGHMVTLKLHEVLD